MAKSYVSLPVGYYRVDAEPLEKNTKFETYAEANAYATTDPTAYAGQVISVKQDGSFSLYMIQETDGVKRLEPYSSGGGSSEQVQADWDETNPASKAYILNKPTIPTADGTTITDPGTGVLSVGTISINAVDKLGENEGKLTYNGNKLAEISDVTTVQSNLDTFINTTAPATYVAKSEVGQANGVAPLNANGKIDASYLDGEHVVQVIECTDTDDMIAKASGANPSIQVGDLAVLEDGSLYRLVKTPTEQTAVLDDFVNAGETPEFSTNMDDMTQGSVNKYVSATDYDWIQNTQHTVVTTKSGEPDSETYSTDITANQVTVKRTDVTDSTEKQLPVATENDFLFVAPEGESTVSTTVGDVKAGVTDLNLMNVKDIIKQMFYPYKVPAFTAFNMQSVSNSQEVGATISANPTFTWSVSNAANIKDDGFKIEQTAPTAAVLAEGIAKTNTSYASTQEAIKATTPGAYKWRISGVNTNNQGFQRDLTVNYYYKYFYGVDTNDATTPPDASAIGTTYTNADGSAFDSAFIRNTSGYNSAFLTSNTASFSINIQSTTRRIVIACPQGTKLDSVIPAGGSTHYEGSFVAGTMEIATADAATTKTYNVYIYQAALALTAETWNVKFKSE